MLLYYYRRHEDVFDQIKYSRSLSLSLSLSFLFLFQLITSLRLYWLVLLLLEVVLYYYDAVKLCGI